MSHQKTLLTAVAMLAVSLAGCSSAEDGGEYGFVISSTPSDPVTGAFTFKATVSGESYEWDMGDGRAKQSGKTVDYIYGFTDGEVKPKLTVINGGEKTTYKARSITLGSGVNQPPTLALDVEWAWVTVGEEVTFSGASSTDPDGDPILFEWFCLREADIGPISLNHAHAGSGIGYGSGGVESIAATFINGTSDATPDVTATGDICATMNSMNSAFTENGTIRGAFDQRGVYKITMLAKDPKTPSLPGSATIYVTDTNEPRIEAPVVIPFDGTFDYGVPSSLDPAMQEADNTESYIRDHPFVAKYPMVSFQMDFNYDAGAGQNVVTYHIIKPNGDSKDTAEASVDVDKGAGYLTPSNSPHSLRVYGRQGANLSYSGEITITYETDPAKLFEAAAAH